MQVDRVHMARNDDRPVPNEYIIYLGSIHHTSRVHTVPRPGLASGAAVHCQGGCSISVLAHHAATLLSRPATKCYQICVPVYLVDLASRHTDLGFCRFSAPPVCIWQGWPVDHCSISAFWLSAGECDSMWCTLYQPLPFSIIESQL